MAENATPKVGSRDRSSPWYIAGPPDISQASRELLENYSHLQPEEIQAHVVAMRDKAWEIGPYPCIGAYRFLDLSLSNSPAYEHILSLLRDHDASSPAPAPLLLDIGCCFGQDIRKLVYDGAPASRIIGADLVAGFIEMGYELFRDKKTVGVKFVVGDVLGNAFSSLRGTVSVIHASAFFHLWNWDGQVQVGSRLVKLLRDEKGVMIVGRQVGSLKPGESGGKGGPRGRMYRHDGDTFSKLWEQIGEATGTKWKAEAKLDEASGATIAVPVSGTWHDESVRRLTFVVTRVG